VKESQAPLQIHEVLTMLKLLDQGAFRRFLALCQRVEHLMTFKQPRNLGKRLPEVSFWPGIVHWRLLAMTDDRPTDATVSAEGITETRAAFGLRHADAKVYSRDIATRSQVATQPQGAACYP
jgi:hypothetical protein